MIGLTLVVSMGVFASSLKASFGDVLSDQVDADLYVVTSSAQAPGYSPSVLAAVADAEGVDQVSATGWGMARFDGQDSATPRSTPRPPSRCSPWVSRRVRSPTSARTTSW